MVVSWVLTQGLYARVYGKYKNIFHLKFKNVEILVSFYIFSLLLKP